MKNLCVLGLLVSLMAFAGDHEVASSARQTNGLSKNVEHLPGNYTLEVTEQADPLNACLENIKIVYDRKGDLMVLDSTGQQMSDLASPYRFWAWRFENVDGEPHINKRGVQTSGGLFGTPTYSLTMSEKVVIQSSSKPNELTQTQTSQYYRFGLKYKEPEVREFTLKLAEDKKSLILKVKYNGALKRQCRYSKEAN